MFEKKTIRGIPKSEENLIKNDNGYHIFGQNIRYQYPQKVLNNLKYLQIVPENQPILAYTSSVGEIGIIAESFYRTGNNGAFQGLFSKKHKFSLKELQFILPVLRKHFDTFGYNTSMAEVINLKIQLPTTDRGNIDFEFMENFVAELEEQYVAELEAQSVTELETYLNVTGLKDYELTEEEINILNNFETINLKEFKINDLFNVDSSKKRFDANKVSVTENIGHPYVVRTALNNGIKGCINEDTQFLNPGNTISFGQDTATMFYQENSYFTGDKIKVLSSKEDNFNKKRALYFITNMAKSFKTFSWGASSFNVNVINNQLLTVPVIDDEIDYYTIELLISAIQKLVIKDIVKYNDMKIQTTKKIINN